MSLRYIPDISKQISEVTIWLKQPNMSESLYLRQTTWNKVFQAKQTIGLNQRRKILLIASSMEVLIVKFMSYSKSRTFDKTF